MSLAAAIQQLPDDRDTRQALNRVLEHFSAHRSEEVEPRRLASATGLLLPQVNEVLRALQAGFVIDCGTDMKSCVYAPSSAMKTEVDRYLYSSERSHDKFRGSVERFRGSYTRGR